jgi:RNA polymerase sigma-70 factor (ECF subfamily)
VGSNTPHDRRQEFEEVALPHLNALFNLGLNLTRNRKDAEDLVQEAYLRAYRFFDSYRTGTNIKAWLFRILRNTFINRYRAAKARPDAVDFEKIEAIYERVVTEEHQSRNPQLSPEDRLLHGVMDEMVQNALGELPEEYRSVVLLALVEDMAYKEIAETLSIPIGTVMSRLHRGRKHLQAALLEYAQKKGITRRRPSVSKDDGVEEQQDG